MKHKLIWLILLVAFFLRVYRCDALTGFYFDQGRDAKIIWDLWHSQKFFLIGPTTGIEGIFLGPFYYYLIAPFYLLGNGDPVFPALELALINTAAIYVIYRIGRDYFSLRTGLLAAVFISFSLPLVQAHRWLSNPTPLPLASAVAVYILMQIINRRDSPWSWLLLGLSIGLGLHFEAASAVFFLPASLVIVLLNRRNINWKPWNVLNSVFAFLVTLLPQIYFNLRHNNLIVDAFVRFLISEKSFTPVLTDFYSVRLKFYFDAFFQKLFLDKTQALIFAVILLIAVLLTFRKLVQKEFVLLLIWWLTPMVFLLFYHGNHGFVWDYYFTGVYPIFMLLVAIILSHAFSLKKTFASSLVVFFMLAFSITNLSHMRNYLSSGINGKTAIMLGSSLAAVDWLFQDAKDTPFNVDAYVPPVITHSYDYLILWRGSNMYRRLPQTEQVPVLYTIYEEDPPHPERLQVWLDRQATYATPEASARFGGVTVERRKRI